MQVIVRHTVQTLLNQIYDLYRETISVLTAALRVLHSAILSYKYEHSLSKFLLQIKYLGLGL